MRETKVSIQGDISPLLEIPERRKEKSSFLFSRVPSNEHKLKEDVFIYGINQQKCKLYKNNCGFRIIITSTSSKLKNLIQHAITALQKKDVGFNSIFSMRKPKVLIVDVFGKYL